jgi:hypothetical protein
MRRGADAGLAFGMLLLDAVGVGITFLVVIGSSLDEALDPSSVPDPGEASVGEVAAIGFGLVAAFAVLSCVLLLRNQARISGTLQGLVAGVALLVALGSLVSERAEAGLDEAPYDSETSDTYQGPGGQCRSGGGSEECEGTAG